MWKTLKLTSILEKVEKEDLKLKEFYICMCKLMCMQIKKERKRGQMGKNERGEEKKSGREQTKENERKITSERVQMGDKKRLNEKEKPTNKKRGWSRGEGGGEDHNVTKRRTKV